MLNKMSQKTYTKFFDTRLLSVKSVVLTLKSVRKSMEPASSGLFELRILGTSWKPGIKRPVVKTCVKIGEVINFRSSFANT